MRVMRLLAGVALAAVAAVIAVSVTEGLPLLVALAIAAAVGLSVSTLARLGFWMWSRGTGDQPTDRQSEAP